jgi:hypothetical protein
MIGLVQIVQKKYFLLKFNSFIFFCTKLPVFCLYE